MLDLARDLQTVMRALDDHLEELHGKRIGIMLFVFEFCQPDGDGTNVVYIANSEREESIKAVKEWLARAEAGMTSDPPGPLPRA
jgi:hypothetical protein